MIKKTLWATLVVGTLCMFCSCATIVTGTAPKVIINGDTNEPVTIRTSYKTYENVMLPTQVQVRRKHLSGQHISVSSKNYTYQDIMIDKKTNGWAWGNLALGGLIGWIIDLGTNAVSEPRQKEYTIHGVQKKYSEYQTEAGISAEVAMPTFPCDAIIEKKNGRVLDGFIHSIENGLVLYHLRGKSPLNTSTIETSKLNNIYFIINESFQPSFPCDAEIKLSKDSFWTPIKLHGIEENTISYNIKQNTYKKSLDNIYEIRFYISNSVEEYNLKMYYYGKED